MRESEVLDAVHSWLAAQPDVWIRRNNTGVFKTEDGRRVRTGLGVGGPDLIGSVLVRGAAIAIGIEVKAPKGVVSEEQHTWHRGAMLMGWRVCVARCVDDARAFVESVRGIELS